eukprot:2763212-Pleurochrysis_carterae.AAC.1
MSYIPTSYLELLSPIYPMAIHVLPYLPTFLCPRRVYVWASSKLVTKLSRDSTAGRSSTDGRLDRLGGKTVVTSHRVTFT